MTDHTEASVTVSPILLDNAERTACEVWSRVMGYHRPIENFNLGKQAEHAERRYFREPQTERIEHLQQAA